MKVSEKTLKILENANKKEPFICGYSSSQIQRDYKCLIDGNKVEVDIELVVELKIKLIRYLKNG